VLDRIEAAMRRSPRPVLGRIEGGALLRGLRCSPQPRKRSSRPSFRI